MKGAITAAQVAEFLGQGMLDVLVDLFKSDPALYGLLGELLASPELGVRLGTSALVEELAVADPERRPLAAVVLAPLLGASYHHRHFVIRLGQSIKNRNGRNRSTEKSYAHFGSNWLEARDAIVHPLLAT